jgi:TPR repeat protein
MTRSKFSRISRRQIRDAMWLRANFLEEMSERRSLREAFRLTRKAVRLGLTDARGSLGFAYDHANGTRPSRRMALHWYRKGWRSGSATAARNIGVTMRMEGRRRSAMLWFKRAIVAGDPDARLDLAKLLVEKEPASLEAHGLLEEYIQAGPQEMYELRPVGSYPRVDMEKLLEDDGLKEAQILLDCLKAGKNE